MPHRAALVFIVLSTGILSGVAGCGGAEIGVAPEWDSGMAGAEDARYDLGPGGLDGPDAATLFIKGDPLRDCMIRTLPRLTVAGNRLMIRCGDRIVPTRLKGINRSGLQHKLGLRLAGFGMDPTPELQRWRDEWRTVAVRVPLAQTYYLFYQQYRDDLDLLVAAARSLGLYLILELHGYDAENLHHQQPDPNATPGFWAQLARRYGAETHVVFDLWNEPWGVQWAQWKGNAELILRAIRGAGATDTLVLVGGLDYAYDLSPLLDPQNRIQNLGPVIYATHPYPLKSRPPSMAAEWDAKFGNVARIVPVILGEYGVDDSRTEPFGLGDVAAARAWMEKLHAYVDQHELSALAWSAGDAPQISLGVGGGPVALPANPPDPGRVTVPFGESVKAWMVKPIM